jgi:hypothetical protein
MLHYQQSEIENDDQDPRLEREIFYENLCKDFKNTDVKMIDFSNIVELKEKELSY